ncbi:hypothetical protein ACFWGC_29275 [Cytobacillus pseudoceanisediminis]|uniref:hypothetical protein n=1 Tax=Bacillaceae TaxID=186817 RepID=UPI001A8D7D1D|nr:hypothetical protein [Bacillus sp. NTK034]MBN8199191.1 hypothetical protein [Bacillus sp. NTK034]
MFKVGDIIEHDNYGKGEVTAIENESKSLWVSFDKKHEVVIYDVIDKPHYFEDNTRLTYTNFIRVFESEVRMLSSNHRYRNNRDDYINNCHSCKKLLSSQTHPYCIECEWLKCECGSCKCNYKGRNFKKV